MYIRVCFYNCNICKYQFGEKLDFLEKIQIIQDMQIFNLVNYL